MATAPVDCRAVTTMRPHTREQQPPTRTDLPPEIQVVLIDFDETLTAEHTGGALNVHRQMPLFYRRYDGAMVPLHRNVAGGKARFLFTLLHDVVVRQGRWLGVVTFADRAQEPARRRELWTPTLQATFDTLGGEALVHRWLWALALDAHAQQENAAERALHELLHTHRFGVVARMPAPSAETFGPGARPNKRGHVESALLGFREHGGLNLDALQRRQVLVIDNTEYLLQDLAYAFPDLRVEHVPRGLTPDAWRNVHQRLWRQHSERDDNSLSTASASAASSSFALDTSKPIN